MALKHTKGRIDAKDNSYPSIGDTFFRWEIVGYPKPDGNGKKFICKCLCGNIKTVAYSLMKRGLSKSCGCFRSENASILISLREHKHNLSKHPLYRIWAGMRNRCYNKKDKGYKDYGGRGIFVCDEWKNDFKPFYDWAISAGWKKGLKNDRRDNDKGYSPQNCRFVNDSVSMRNTRRNVFIEYNGETMVITDWAKKVGITTESLKKRLYKLKWPIDKALTQSKTLKQ